MQCQIEGDRYEFLAQLEKYTKDSKPNMELIREQPQISVLMREDKKSVRKYLYLLLSDLNNSFKVNPEYKLNESEIIDMVVKISKDYYFYKLHDFAIFVENAKSGKYGKSYNRLDIPTIYEWLVKYDVERCELSRDYNLAMRITDDHERESPKNKLNLDKMRESFKTSQIAAINEENEKLKKIDKF